VGRQETARAVTAALLVAYNVFFVGPERAEASAASANSLERRVDAVRTALLERETEARETERFKAAIESARVLRERRVAQWLNWGNWGNWNNWNNWGNWGNWLNIP
jgi:hypothetical protein